MATLAGIDAEIAKRERLAAIDAEIAKRQENMPSVGERVLGGLEGAASMASGLIAEPIAGLSGLVSAVNPFAEEGAGAQTVKDVREMLTYQPRLQGAKDALATIGGAVEPVAKKLSEFEGTLGEYVMQTTGNAELAAIAHTLPTATLELLGGGVARRAAKNQTQAPLIDQAKKTAVSEVDQLEQGSGVRQLTSDVLEPETRAAKFMQQQGELIDGGQRVAQQAERVKAIDSVLSQYDISDAARFEQGIVDSVKRSIDAKKSELASMYEASTAQLDQLGNVPLSKSKAFAEKVINKESVKGSLADESIIKEMQDYMQAPDDLTFDTVKSIRSAVGAKLKQARQGAPVQGSSDTAMLSQLYASLSKDMKGFADNVAPELADKWKEADKEFSGFATGNNKSGMKRLVKDGDTTPEIVDQLLFSPKKSDIEFLSRNLDESGKVAAKQRILQKMMEKSSPDGVEVNPNRFLTQLNKLRKQTDAMFNPSEIEALSSLKQALSKTRRAQDASVTTPTGQQVLPLFAMTNPIVLAPGVLQAMIERPMLRNLLIKRKAAKTVKGRNKIDLELQNKIDELGLAGAATSGSAANAIKEEKQ